jgi:hypothetical protein
MRVADLLEVKEAEAPPIWDQLKQLLAAGEDVWITSVTANIVSPHVARIESAYIEKGTHGFYIRELKPDGSAGSASGLSPRLLDASRLVESDGHYLFVIRQGVKLGPDRTSNWVWKGGWVYEKPLEEDLPIIFDIINRALVAGETITLTQSARGSVTELQQLKATRHQDYDVELRLFKKNANGTSHLTNFATVADMKKWKLKKKADHWELTL